MDFHASQPVCLTGEDRAARGAPSADRAAPLLEHPLSSQVPHNLCICGSQPVCDPKPHSIGEDRAAGGAPGADRAAPLPRHPISSHMPCVVDSLSLCVCVCVCEREIQREVV